jgi:transcription elongation factor Elf1
MTIEIAVNTGTELTAAEQSLVTRAVRLRPNPARRDVQAQLGSVVLCPYCGGIGYDEEPDAKVHMGFYICSCCGLMFKA